MSVVQPTDADAAADPGYAAMDDGALVLAAAGGARDAFDIIVERHRRTVYQVCYRFAGNHEDASDLAQDTFVRAWRGVARFRGQAALSTWLYRIAINVCLNRAALKTPAPDQWDAIDRIEDTRTEPPGDSLLRDEQALAVRRAVAALPNKQRATVILRSYHELSHEQIAAILGSSVGTAKANFFHALANLRKTLGRQP